MDGVIEEHLCPPTKHLHNAPSHTSILQTLVQPKSYHHKCVSKHPLPTPPKASPHTVLSASKCPSRVSYSSRKSQVSAPYCCPPQDFKYNFQNFLLFPLNSSNPRESSTKRYLFACLFCIPAKKAF